MKKAKFNSQSGKSLLEILIVLVVGAVIIAMAVTGMTSAKANITRQNYAREFKGNLERARYDAVKRRAKNLDQMARIKILTATSYEVYLDYDQNGILESTEKRTFTITAQSNVKILGTDLVFPTTIRFNHAGNTTVSSEETTPATAVTPVFTFCEGICTLTTATVKNSNIIMLSPTGTVAMLNGGEALPTFNAPSTTTVAGNDIDEWLVVSNENATPNPTVSPTVLPTTAPTTAPTPTTPTPTTPTPTTPTPTTPTPTPTNYCQSGQKPSTTGCVCKLPMTTKGNGVCR